MIALLFFGVASVACTGLIASAAALAARAGRA
jgi:hypothetical protein